METVGSVYMAATGLPFLTAKEFVEADLLNMATEMMSVMDALYVITTGVITCSCIIPSSCSASGHCWPFPHVLLEALYVMTTGVILCCCIFLSKCSASARCCPFSHALMEKL